MKRIYILAMAVFMALGATTLALAAEKLDRLAAKEAKKLEKEGWTVRPGAMPLEQQLLKSYELQSKTDDDMYPLYIMGEATSVGENYDAAKTSAMSLAMTNLAGQIQTELTALIENTVVLEKLTITVFKKSTQSQMNLSPRTSLIPSNDERMSGLP